MARSKSVASAGPVVPEVVIDVRFEQPLGYGVMHPLDGRSLDEAFVDAWKALGAQTGDVLSIAIRKQKESTR